MEEKLYNLVCQYLHDESLRKSVLKYCEVSCGWPPYQFVAEESFKICLDNYKKEHPEVNLD